MYNTRLGCYFKLLLQFLLPLGFFKSVGRKIPTEAKGLKGTISNYLDLIDYTEKNLLNPSNLFWPTLGQRKTSLVVFL